MSLFSNLRSKWRQHDEKLAEKAYENRETDAQLDEHAEDMDHNLSSGSGFDPIDAAQDVRGAADL